MKKVLTTKEKRIKRIKAKVIGTGEKPRLSVFRSNRQIYAQLIDDQKGKTLVSASGSDLKEKNSGKINQAHKIGEILAQKAQEKKIRQVVFDRHGYKYHGRVKALAEGARAKGLVF